MSEEEYRKLAADAGYSEEEIQDLIDTSKETGIPLDDIPLLIHNVD